MGALPNLNDCANVALGKKCVLECSIHKRNGISKLKISILYIFHKLLIRGLKIN